MQYLAYWGAPQHQQPSLAWLRAWHDSMRPYVTGGAYVNYADPDLTNWQAAYYGSNYPRLVAVKQALRPRPAVPLPAGDRLSRSGLPGRGIDGPSGTISADCAGLLTGPDGLEHSGSAGVTVGSGPARLPRAACAAGGAGGAPPAHRIGGIVPPFEKAPHGRRLGCRPRRLSWPGPKFADCGLLRYGGGPVMHSSTVYTIFWQPTGYTSLDGQPAYSAGYRVLIAAVLPGSRGRQRAPDERLRRRHAVLLRRAVRPAATAPASPLTTSSPPT